MQHFRAIKSVGHLFTVELHNQFGYGLPLPIGALIRFGTVISSVLLLFSTSDCKNDITDGTDGHLCTCPFETGIAPTSSPCFATITARS